MLFETKVSERTLCGALMLALHDELKGTEYEDYFVDVEYNRNVGGRVKTIRREKEQIVKINCDLIVHSRGMNLRCDNLIALEMKKSTGRKIDKDSDRVRLECLTKIPRDDIWPYGGEIYPEYVCGYGLGIYYEVNLRRKTLLIEYYNSGKCYKVEKLQLKSFL